MFIELAELLRCSGDHEQMPCVVAPEEMDGRRVVRGLIGCPVCKAEHQIVDGVAGFGADPLLAAGSRSDDLTVEEMPSAETVQALLDLREPRGYLALVGSGSRLATELSALVPDMHMVGFNPPPGMVESPNLSLLRAHTVIPLRDGTVRGVFLGKEYVRNRWMNEAGRVLATGGRMVAVTDQPAATGVTPIAAEGGLWLGEKTAQVDTPARGCTHS